MIFEEMAQTAIELMGFQCPECGTTTDYTVEWDERWNQRTITCNCGRGWFFGCSRCPDVSSCIGCVLRERK